MGWFSDFFKVALPVVGYMVGGVAGGAIGGAIAGGIAGSEQAKEAKKAANFDKRKLERERATLEREAAATAVARKRESERLADDRRQTIGSLRARLAASGLDLGFGTGGTLLDVTASRFSQAQRDLGRMVKTELDQLRDNRAQIRDNFRQIDLRRRAAKGMIWKGITSGAASGAASGYAYGGGGAAASAGSTAGSGGASYAGYSYYGGAR